MRIAMIATSMAAMLACAGQASAQRGRGPNPARYGWMSDFDTAKKRAKQTGKPIMLVLRCGP